MTRKLIAMALCVMMLASLITIPALADTSVYLDYVPGEMPANMIKSVSEAGGTSGLAVGFARVAEDRVTYSFVDSYRHYSLIAKGEAGGPMTGTAPGDGHANGLYASTGIIKGNGYVNADGVDQGDIAGAKSYVYKMQVKNLNPDIIPNVHAKIYDYDAGGSSQYDIEHGATGMAVTSTDWMDFQGTIYNKDDSHITQTINGRDAFSFGFPTDGTMAGSSVLFNVADERSGMYTPYFAVEQAYDITNERTSEGAILTSKNPATFKAQIVNQIGSAGYLDQGTFTWQAFAADDTARVTPVSGFSFDGNGDVTVTVDSTVAPGEYVIVAYNEAAGMAKGVAITVDTPSEYVDWTPGEKPANLINSNTAGNNSNLQYFTQSNDQVVKVSWDNWKHVVVKSLAAYDGASKVGTASYMMPGAYVHGTIMPSDTIKNEESYVVNFFVKAGEGSDGVVRDTYANAGILNYRSSYRLNVTEEYGTQGMPVSTDWKEFKGTISTTSVVNSGEPNARLSIGLSTQALAGTGVIISDGLYGEPGKVYFAEEAVYDITNEIVSENTVVNARDSITLKATVVNQLELPGTLSQKFTWKALDKATRKVEIEGITITPSEDTTTAVVAVDESVAPGEYVIVATSTDYAMTMGCNITVEEPNYYLDYVETEVPENIFLWEKIKSNIYDMQYASVQQDDGTRVKQLIDWTGHTWGYQSLEENDGTSVIGKVRSNSRIPGGEMRDPVMTENLQQDQGYVLKFQTRNTQESSVIPAKVNAAVLNRKAGSKTNYPAEYGKEGFQLAPGTDWQWYKASIYVADTVAGYEDQLHPLLDIGLSEMSLKGTGMQIYFFDTFYLGKEKAMKVAVSTDNEGALYEGAAAEFTADTLNQIDSTGNLSQDIEWRVMNKARTSDIDGFDISVADDGTATITVKGAAAGTYDVVAYNPAYKLAMGYEITVEEEEITSVTVDTSVEGKAILSAATVVNTDSENVRFVIASYTNDGAKLVEAFKQDVTAVNGLAVLTEAITINAPAGSSVRVFVWDAYTLTPIVPADGVVLEY